MTDEQMNILIECKKKEEVLRQSVKTLKYDQDQVKKRSQNIDVEVKKLKDKYQNLVKEYPVIGEDLEFKELSIEDAETELYNKKHEIRRKDPSELKKLEQEIDNEYENHILNDDNVTEEEEDDQNVTKNKLNRRKRPSVAKRQQKQSNENDMNDNDNDGDNSSSDNKENNDDEVANNKSSVNNDDESVQNNKYIDSQQT